MTELTYKKVNTLQHLQEHH